MLNVLRCSEHPTLRKTVSEVALFGQSDHGLDAYVAFYIRCDSEFKFLCWASTSSGCGVGIQELQTPELQPLSMESKAALALLKYLPLTPQVIPQVPTLPSCLVFLVCFFTSA